MKKICLLTLLIFSNITLVYGQNFLEAKDYLSRSQLGGGFDSKKEEFLTNPCLEGIGKKIFLEKSEGTWAVVSSNYSYENSKNFELLLNLEIIASGFGGKFFTNIINESREKGDEISFTLSLKNSLGNETFQNYKKTTFAEQIHNPDEFKNLCGDEFVEQIQKGFEYTINIQLKNTSPELRNKFKLEMGVSLFNFMIAANFLLENEKKNQNLDVEIELNQKGGEFLKPVAGDLALADSRFECKKGELKECFKFINQLLSLGEKAAATLTSENAIPLKYVLRPYSDLYELSQFTSPISSVEETQLIGKIKKEASTLAKKLAMVRTSDLLTKNLREELDFHISRDLNYIESLLDICVGGPQSCFALVFSPTKPIYPLFKREVSEFEGPFYSDFVDYCERAPMENPAVFRTIKYLRNKFEIIGDFSCFDLYQRLKNKSEIDLAFGNEGIGESGQVEDLGIFFFLPNLRNLILKGQNISRAPQISFLEKGLTLSKGAKNKDINIVNYLLGNLEDIESKDILGYTALHYAAIENDLDLINLLLLPNFNIDINSRDVNNDTPLHLAYLNGNQAVVDLLLANGADSRARNLQGKIPGQLIIAQTSNQNKLRIDLEGNPILLDSVEMENFKKDFGEKLDLEYYSQNKDLIKGEISNFAEENFSYLNDQPIRKTFPVLFKDKSLLFVITDSAIILVDRNNFLSSGEQILLTKATYKTNESSSFIVTDKGILCVSEDGENGNQRNITLFYIVEDHGSFTLKKLPITGEILPYSQSKMVYLNELNQIWIFGGLELSTGKIKNEFFVIDLNPENLKIENITSEYQNLPGSQFALNEFKINDCVDNCWRILITGGITPTNEIQKFGYLLNPYSRTLKQIEMAYPRAGHESIVIGNTIWQIGGLTREPKENNHYQVTPVLQIEAFDIDKNIFYKIPYKIKKSRLNHKIVKFQKGNQFYLVLVGGITGNQLFSAKDFFYKHEDRIYHLGNFYKLCQESQNASSYEYGDSCFFNDDIEVLRTDCKGQICNPLSSDSLPGDFIIQNREMKFVTHNFSLLEVDGEDFPRLLKLGGYGVNKKVRAFYEIFYE